MKKPLSHFGHGGYELRDIHDWDNPLRPFIDCLELFVLISITGFGLFHGLGGAGSWTDDEGPHSAPIWKLFTSWHAFSHLIVGVCIFLVGLLLLRDWMYGLDERREEQWRRKLWNEERTETAKLNATGENSRAPADP